MVSAGCVRVSLFQSSSPPQGEGAVPQARRALLRSRAEDYRGDLLIPLPSLASAFLLGAAKEFTCATVRDLRDGLERRLSAHCVLHVPAAQSKRFVEEHQLVQSSVTLSPTPAAAGRAPGAPSSSAARPPFRCCSNCSSSVVTEAAAAAAPAASTCAADTNSSSQRGHGAISVPQAPWISICQLQRMSHRPKDVLTSAPSSSSDAAQTPEGHPDCTAEEWMLRQHDSANVYLSAAEAHAVGAVDAESEMCATDKVEGGGCYTAFFCLTTIAASEQAARIASLRPSAVPLARSEPSASNITSFKPTAFTVHARQHTLRIGVPPVAAASPADPNRSALHVPTLQDVVVDRLAAQRGVRVTRLLDTQSGAAVLPGESALTLLAADVAALEVECVKPSSQPQSHVVDEALTQPLERVAETPPMSRARAPSQANVARKRGAAEETAELLSRLVGARAHGTDTEQYYFDGVDVYSWAEQRTLISLSEVPSDPELQLGFQDSHTGSAPHTPGVSSQLSAEASLLALLSSDNSRSCPMPCATYDAGDAMVGAHLEATGKQGDEVNAGSSARHHATRAQGPHVLQRSHHSISPVTAHSPPHLEAEAAEEETARLSPAQLRSPQATPPCAASAALRDSLWDMNEVFVYEDDAEDADANSGAPEPEVIAEGSSGSQSREQRRGSLVWSTPIARGSAGATALGDTGISATPLLYRTSSRLSLSPLAHHGTAQSTPTTTAAEAAERPTQRMLIADSDSDEERGHHTVNGGAGTDAEEVSRDRDDEAAAGRTMDSVHDEVSEDEETHSVDVDAMASPPSAAEGRSESTPSHERTPPRPPPPTASERSTGPVLSAMPSPAGAAASLPSPHPHQPTPHSRTAARFGPNGVFSTMELDEQTTCMAPPPCSTPPLPLSPSRASEQELRSRLQSINPVPTQSSSTPPHQQRPSESQHAMAIDMCEEDVRSGTVLHQQGRVPEVTTLDARDSPVSEGAVSPCGKSPASTPSTAVAGRAQRARSPIFFSPEELDGMALEIAATTATTASENNNLYTRSASSGRGLVMVDTLDRTPPTPPASQRHNHYRDYGYGNYIASYPLHPGGGSSTSDAGADREGRGVIAAGAGWGSSGSAHSSALPRSSRRAATDGEARFVPSPSLSPSPTSQHLPAPDARGETGVRSSAALSGAAALTSPSRRIDRGKRPRSPSGSASASGHDRWICFSDADKSSDNGGGSADTGLHMLVTQQELPVYTGQSDASSTGSDADEDGGSDQSSSGSTVTAHER